MTDHNEIRALKAAVGGAADTAAALASMQPRIDALDDHAEIDAEILAELGRVSAAHAIASAALRGLVNTMQNRRGAAAT